MARIWEERVRTLLQFRKHSDATNCRGSKTILVFSFLACRIAVRDATIVDSPLKSTRHARLYSWPIMCLCEKNKRPRDDYIPVRITFRLSFFLTYIYIWKAYFHFKCYLKTVWAQYALVLRETDVFCVIVLIFFILLLHR